MPIPVRTAAHPLRYTNRDPGPTGRVTVESFDCRPPARRPSSVAAVRLAVVRSLQRLLAPAARAWHGEA